MKRIKDFLKSQTSKVFVMNGIQVAEKVVTMLLSFVVYVILFFLIIALINYLNIPFLTKPQQLVAISGFIYVVLKFCLKVDKGVENRANTIKKIIIETFAISYLFLAFIFKTMLPTVQSLYNIFVLCFLLMNAIDRLHKSLYS
ncbi:TPA: hypothetical protein ACGPBJ_001992 [Streptococcus suis]